MPGCIFGSLHLCIFTGCRALGCKDANADSANAESERHRTKIGSIGQEQGQEQEQGQGQGRELAQLRRHSVFSELENNNSGGEGSRMGYNSAASIGMSRRRSTPSSCSNLFVSCTPPSRAPPPFASLNALGGSVPSLGYAPRVTSRLDSIRLSFIPLALSAGTPAGVSRLPTLPPPPLSSHQLAPPLRQAHALTH
ncbi:hypothetical protein PLEOSDRAFT_1108646 [Pleurotus ostreatus PC15]|uniref:Uncharacterized protein n=1 Tax=Pleurotus ostreatus (strain PC15) TaxID=1137138 RepID=A0A067NGX2_PLEO1|nr:hypothetical protein PLEOSDRAFT_1108646 [Pleurotus ostreatus PC15]